MNTEKSMKIYIVYFVVILNMADEVITDIDRVTLTPPGDAIPETDRGAIKQALGTYGGADVYREMEVTP